MPQVFYAMCQGLLYALCYHLENLLHPQSDSDVNFEAAQLQHVHISSQTQAHASVHQNSWQQEGMSPAQLKQQLADLLLTILRHRYAVLPKFHAGYSVTGRHAGVVVVWLVALAVDCIKSSKYMVLAHALHALPGAKQLAHILRM